jgi:hypothetical protein
MIYWYMYYLLQFERFVLNFSVSNLNTLNVSSTVSFHGECVDPISLAGIGWVTGRDFRFFGCDFWSLGCGFWSLRSSFLGFLCGNDRGVGCDGCVSGGFRSGGCHWSVSGGFRSGGCHWSIGFPNGWAGSANAFWDLVLVTTLLLGWVPIGVTGTS